MQLNEHIRLWNHVFIKIIDIRYSAMDKGEELSSYRLPASAFMYTVRGSAKIWLDRQMHTAKRFHLFHGGKGMNLAILAEDELEYYMILYKPTLALPSAQDLAKRIEKDNPFHYQYAFEPSAPLALFDKVERLYEEWRQETGLGRLQVKAGFYQFVYELLWQWHQQEVAPIRPDLAAMAIRYIHEYYNKPLTLETIAAALECSEGHLSRLFKNKTGSSPMHYLGQIRTLRTTQLLLRTDATLQEIAESVGFPDAHSLSRSFKKYKGVSPARYREKYSAEGKGRDLPLLMQGFAVLQPPFYPYNDTENHFHYPTGRELLMQRRTKIAVMALVMCFTLLISACGGIANTNGSPSNAPANQSAGASNTETSPAAQQAEPQAATRIVATPKGDVEVPVNPQRVAADQYMGHLLKLGIIPVGVRSFMLNEAWLGDSGISQDVLDGIEDLGGFPMNLEKLTYLEPDLIIGSIDENIEQYEKVGTTVFLPYWEELKTAGPLEKFRNVSKIFGKEKEAEQWITEYDTKVEAAKAKIAGIVKEGETVSIVQFGYKALYVIAAEGGNYGSSTIYQMLELPPTQQAKDMKDGFVSISLEVLSQYTGDHIFLYGAEDEGSEEILNSELWKQLPAVQKGQVYKYGTFGENGDEFVMEDPYSLELQLEKVVSVMTANQK
ncbi:AraC family transcriptional regulator [Paenibacillus sp. BIHB 4019]|uniref:AraC family transcriptional regulator n=2 Tax=Paenibacillus sp. BIHB 4019 TaxID=1870819 RepID=A0A1B2DKV4_9BACL|nr:AraC family transcriptional regulator [Paenibacillus sp. BIHB 4019]